MGKYVEQYRRKDEQERRLQQRIEEQCRRTGHGLPVTRRDFLSRGLISGLGMVFAPTLSTFLARQAHAECDLTTLVQGAGKIPFISIDQGGGANLAGSNVMVGSVGQENFLSPDGYARLGLPEAIIPDNVGVDRTFGIAMHPNSAMLQGMLDKATSAATRAGTNGVVIPARSENDTGNNPHNPIYGIAQAGANGQFVAAIGTRNSDSGGRSVAPDYMINPEFRPVKVSNSNEATGLAGGDEDGFPSGDVAAAAAVISELKLGRITVEQATRELVQCGYDKSSATFNTAITATELDPNQDPDLQAIFPGGELNQGDYRKAAAVMKTVIKGFAGAGTIEYGGRDYHQDPRPETDEKDFVVGQVIGATLEYAQRSNQPVMIYVFSDGAVSADTNNPEVVPAQFAGADTTKFRWRSDNSQTAASAIFVYRPGGVRPVLRGNAANTNQLGTFRMDGNVETGSTPFANNVTSLAEMVVLNYLGLHGQAAMFGADVLPGNGLGTGAAVDPFIAFDPIV